METLTSRLRVRHKPTGQRGIIVAVYNLGKLGELHSTTGAKFIVWAADCSEATALADPFEDLEQLLPGGCYWVTERRHWE
jgi:hypothetical protein